MGQELSYIIVECGSKTARLQLDSFPILIGRDPANSIAIDDDEASRFHLKIKKRLSTHIVHDLNSKNGTLLNGKRISNTVLKNNDILTIGKTRLTFFCTVSIEQSIASQLLEGKEVRFEHYTRISVQQLCSKGEASIDERAMQALCLKMTRIYSIDLLASKIIIYAKKQMPNCAGATFSLWDEEHQQLVVAAQRYWRGNHARSSKALVQVISRRCAILASNKNMQVVILPVLLFAKVPIAMLQLQFHTRQDLTMLATIQLLLQRIVSHIEMLSRRNAMQRWSISMVNSIAKIIEEKDTYTMGHSQRVSNYVAGIAATLGLDDDTTHNLKASALCHDVGKVGIPDSILKKGGMLDHDEYEEMKLHPVLGADIVSHLPNAKSFVSGIMYHHERWDGTGYPDGLEGESIPFFARIIAVADSFDAMISGRSYSGFMHPKDAVAKLAQSKDIYDPEILAAFVKAYRNDLINLKSDTVVKKL
ncbi:MAG: HD domain-containing protein [Pseudomonadota bacterium]|nr:HD domain-containing protein [Pseudomonadota bacterium]